MGGKKAIEQQTAFIFQNAVESNAKTMFCISDFGKKIAFKVKS